MRSSTLRVTLTLLVLAALAAVPVSAATFNLQIVDGTNPPEGFNDETPVDPVPGNPGTTLGEQRTNVFEAAAEVWGELLESDVVIEVEIAMDPLFCSSNAAALGAAGPTFVFRDFPDAVQPDTWHTYALANARAGSNLGPPDLPLDTPQIVSAFNSTIDSDPNCLGGFDWWYGIDSPAPQGTIDFFTVVLHELAHGLGFTTFVNRQTGAKFDGRDDTYMINLEDHSTAMTWDEMTDQERIESTTDTGDLHWVGGNVVANSEVLLDGRHPSGHVQMFAPPVNQPGSSISHFDSAVTPDELMEPFFNANSTNLLTTDLLQDVGWPATAPGPVGPCEPDDDTLCIDDVMGDRRFQVEVQFSTLQGGGGAGAGHAISLTPVGINDGGLFWFFDPSNPEMLVKVINGCPVNGNYWVFYAATTNVGLVVEVTDTQTGLQFITTNPDRNPAPPVQTIQAFPCDAEDDG